MRFYFQDKAAGNFATKCIRVSSTATTQDVIETLAEKFRPDMRMLSSPKYSLYEVHVSGGQCVSAPLARGSRQLPRSSLPGRLTPAASPGGAGEQCTGGPGLGGSGKSVLLSLQHMYLLGVRRTVLMFYMFISPKVSSVAFPN